MKFAFAIIAVALAASNPPFHDPHTGDVNEHDGTPVGRGMVNYKHAAPKRKDPKPENPWKDPEHVGRGKLEKIAEQDRRPAQPTSFPTSFPTKSDSGCKYGRRTVHVGWKGPGLNSNYCNLWQCTKKGMVKAQRECKIKGDICSHTTCDFVKDFKTKRKCRQGEKKCFVMVKSHHSEEVGGRHRCGYSKHTHQCRCVCSGKRRQDAPGFERTLNEIADELNIKNAMPKEVVVHFDFNNRGMFEGHAKHIIQRTSWSWTHWEWTVSAVGTCGIEEYKDTTSSFYLAGGNNMAWHVNNNAGIKEGQCKMSTTNAWTPPANVYDKCQFTFEVTDLDEYQYKESSDKICFKVVDGKSGETLGKEICQQDDVDQQKRTVFWQTRKITSFVKTLKTPMMKIPTNGVNIEWRAVTNSEDEHWYGDNLKILCKKNNDRTSDEWNEAYNAHSFYSSHKNTKGYSENDHTYEKGTTIGHYHNA